MNQNITNLRNVIQDYPKLWEWEAKFENLDQSVSELITAVQLTVLSENADLPGVEVADGTLVYKGAESHFGTRMKLDGIDLKLKFKEIKGDSPANSWLVRRAMIRWLYLIDDFFGVKKSVPQGKVNLVLTMQDELGSEIYQIKYRGVKPRILSPVELNYDVKTDYPLCEMAFSYDYWRTKGSEGF